MRIVLLPESATYTLPLAGSTATPTGSLNCAAGPCPLLLPTTNSVPARVLTTPAGVILRIVLVTPSATYRLPLMGSTATPRGERNCAPDPVPSTLPGMYTVPAMVLTV